VYRATDTKLKRAVVLKVLPAPVATDPEVSPNGRWLAYESNESGRIEVYVRSWPAAKPGRWQVSTEGGRQAAWSHRGRELFYLAPDGALMAVPVESGTGGGFASVAPTRLVEGDRYVNGLGTATVGRWYDVSPDDERFLMVRGLDSSTMRTIVVVQNWTEELKRLAPVKSAGSAGNR
jgi:serine/threonine-protein kinase